MLVKVFAILVIGASITLAVYVFQLVAIGLSFSGLHPGQTVAEVEAQLWFCRAMPAEHFVPTDGNEPWSEVLYLGWITTENGIRVAYVNGVATGMATVD